MPTIRSAPLLALLLVCQPLMAQVDTLRLGTPTDGVIHLDTKRGSAAYASYSFEVDEDVLAFTVELEATADLDLYLDTEYVDDYSDVLASSADYSGSEIIKLDLGRDPADVSPVYYIDVAYGRLEPPVNANGEAIRDIPFTVKVTPFTRRLDAELESGRIVSGRIDPMVDGPYRNYTVEVPSGTPALRIDLASDATDLDLRVRRSKPMRGLADADAVAVSWAGNETIVIDDARDTIPEGTYYIDVFDQSWLDWPADFSLVASFANRPPQGLVDLPMLTPGVGVGLDGAIRATVEVLHGDGGGSGVFLTDTGYILTNYHVVSHVIESAESTAEQSLIGLTIDTTTGSRVRLKARVIEHARDVDMALLKVESDLYGNPLPAGYRFPAVAIGDPAAVTLGDELIVLGYPDAGSLGTRVTLTLTRGVVSGHERRGDLLLIKTDAEISSGNSGGPVLNAEHQLIGLATETISEQFGNSQLGYIYPIWLMPAEWRTIIGQAR
jgi:V8-like Glu-specific endopeptidase